jgi:hypothetical protein
MYIASISRPLTLKIKITTQLKKKRQEQREIRGQNPPSKPGRVDSLWSLQCQPDPPRRRFAAEAITLSNHTTLLVPGTGSILLYTIIITVPSQCLPQPLTTLSFPLWIPDPPRRS